MIIDLNILFTSAGRRVALLGCFREALNALNLRGKLITGDLLPTAPARFAADIHEMLPRITEREYVDCVMDVCRRHNVRLVVPLIDTELHLLAPYRQRFADHGITLLVSSAETTRLALDKRETARFFSANGFDSPSARDSADIFARGGPFPVLIKPARGSAGEGVRRIDNVAELRFYLDTTPEPLVQELLEGTEYTIDVLVDMHGKVRSVVPRRRIEVRSGEVSKGVTEKNGGVIEEARRITEALPGAFGPITLQCFQTPDGRIAFIEINPRFGGGYPLSAAAGADFPRWIIEWILGREPDIGLTDWIDGLYMLRYDDAWFVPGERL